MAKQLRPSTTGSLQPLVARSLLSRLALTPEQMRAPGSRGRSSRILRDLAERTLSGEIEFARLPEMSDDDVIEHLTRVKGIGVWTAQMFLMFRAAPPEHPAHDRLRRAAGDAMKNYRKRKLPKHEQIVKLARTGIPIARSRAGICGGAWTRRRALGNGKKRVIGQ